MGFESFLAETRQLISKSHAHLLPIFDVFAQEARFGLAWLLPDISMMNNGSSILEVGGGLMLVSSELQRRGFDVTVLEPLGEGFSTFSELQGLVLSQAQRQGHAPLVLALPVEALSMGGRYDLAFSVNVMEHVKDVEAALCNVIHALKEGAKYRFVCPNYLFPYEPHFNLPTLFSKKLTERIFWSTIGSSNRVADPEGMWASLNWITVPTIRRIVSNCTNTRLLFGKTIMRDTLARVVTDSQFSSRRSLWMRVLARALVTLRLHSAFALLPAWALPIIDCTIERITPKI